MKKNTKDNIIYSVLAIALMIFLLGGTIGYFSGYNIGYNKGYEKGKKETISCISFRDLIRKADGEMITLRQKTGLFVPPPSKFPFYLTCSKVLSEKESIKVFEPIIEK